MKLLSIIMATILSTMGCTTLSLQERTSINNGEGIMPVMSIENEADSLLLRKKSKPLRKRDILSKEFATLCHRMLLTVQNPENEGVGIAAPQVGILRRVVIVQRVDKEDMPFEIYVNPKIVEYGENKELGGEGCLSVPNRRGDVLRSHSITLRYRDMNFKLHTEDIHGFTAVIFQHEIDHLDGILYIDRFNEEAAEEMTAQ